MGKYSKNLISKNYKNKNLYKKFKKKKDSKHTSKKSKKKFSLKFLKKGNKLIFKLVSCFVILLILIIGILLLLFKTSIFDINNINISINSKDTSELDSIEDISIYNRTETLLKSTINEKLNPYNLVSFNPLNFSNILKNVYPNIISEVNIDKKFPNTLNIKIVKRTPTFLIATPSSRFFVDENGFVVYKILDKELVTIKKDIKIEDIDLSSDIALEELLKDTIEIYQDLDKKIIIGNIDDLDLDSLNLSTIFIDKPLNFDETTEFDKNLIDFMFQILNNFPKTGMSIVTLKMPSIEDSKLIVTTNKNFNVFFNTLKDPIQQIDYLKVLLREKGKELDGANYIDLRFDSRVFIN